MKTIEPICLNDVEFDYDSKSPNAAPNASEIEHVRALINEGYSSGELCMTKSICGRTYTFRGWWYIVA
jgi:hypothetical protein